MSRLNRRSRTIRRRTGWTSMIRRLLHPQACTGRVKGGTRKAIEAALMALKGE